MKIKTTKAIEELFQIFGKRFNNDLYTFFPHVYKKLDNNEYQEMKIIDLPEGLQKYIKTQLGI